jgi:two-component system, LytTR family, response regulator
MDKIRALIVDDEPLARERIVDMLVGDPEVEIIGECGDGLMAVAAVETNKPDLVFLDVQMPELDGFGVLEAIEQPPVIIFVTAYDQYALRAFEVHALDHRQSRTRQRDATLVSRRLRHYYARRRAVDFESQLPRAIAQTSE